jgi:hypothetical protein
MKLLDGLSKIAACANPLAGLILKGIGEVVDYFSEPEIRVKEINLMADQLEMSARLIREATADGVITDEEAEAIKTKLEELEI